jgi:hypothetical protein
LHACSFIKHTYNNGFLSFISLYWNLFLKIGSLTIPFLISIILSILLETSSRLLASLNLSLFQIIVGFILVFDLVKEFHDSKYFLKHINYQESSPTSFSIIFPCIDESFFEIQVIAVFDIGRFFYKFLLETILSMIFTKLLTESITYHYYDDEFFLLLKAWYEHDKKDSYIFF